jgi:hypothetical protein
MKIVHFLSLSFWVMFSSDERAHNHLFVMLLSHGFNVLFSEKR